jgi:superfamily II DNA or RNA helicase
MQTNLPLNEFRTMFEFPPILLEKKISNNVIKLLVLKNGIKEIIIHEYLDHNIKGYFAIDEFNNDEILILFKNSKIPKGFNKILIIQITSLDKEEIITLDKTKAKWLCYDNLLNFPENETNYIKETINSWSDAFRFKEENIDKKIHGLRIPQIGAIHAIHAHWTVSNLPATIVLPTGIGKTETMLSTLISKQCEKILVVVPTEVLRNQIANKFISLGLLKDFGIISETAKFPLVGILLHRLHDENDVELFFNKCNVVVTTMSIVGQCTEEIQIKIASLCSHLFIDEAHHLPAKTWDIFKQKFISSYILQFTATPFREDGKSIEGKIIFNYPLKKAQEEGYFSIIKFAPVFEPVPNKSDNIIAEKAIEQLRADSKYGHMLLARVENISRAKKVFSIYQKYSEFNPVQIHTGLKKSERERIRKEIISGKAKIVVCVDMLGEGFDLPELKIAAFHDIRKSLPVTLQLVGRFTRSKEGLGDPTIIANIADVKVNNELRKLYMQSTDWNYLLPQESSLAIENEIGLQEFLDGFRNVTDEISLRNLRPAMSTVIYKTKFEIWKPDNFFNAIKLTGKYDRIFYDINLNKNVLIGYTTKKVKIDWVNVQDIFTWEWELFIIFWDSEQKLLFIHGSNNNGFYLDLAKAIAGESVEQFKGPQIFKCFYGINRLKLQNVGLLELLGRLIRYTLRTGPDIEPVLTEAQKRNTIKANIFGAGFEDGQKVTIGCSYKGRIWTRKKNNIHNFTIWCSRIGSKLLNDNNDPDEILKGTLVPITISNRPLKMPIGIEWPEEIYSETETTFDFIIGSDEIPLYETEINLIKPSINESLIFEIRSNDVSAKYKIEFYQRGENSDYKIIRVDSTDVFIKYGDNKTLLSDYFDKNPPTIWFVDGSSLTGNSYTEIKKIYKQFPSEKIENWDWQGINLRKESQGINKSQDSIQYKVINELKKKSYDIIFDDDGSGEASDVVAIKVIETILQVELYHCKYSNKSEPGKRISDIYEVCGQAQKSIHWAEKPTELFNHLQRREPKNRKGMKTSRFEVGEMERLFRLKEMSRLKRVEFRIYIVQPGLSKKIVSSEQLELLSVTENYLMETYKIPFGVIASS